MNRYTALLLLVMAILILGTLPLILKLLVQVIDPVSLTGIRFFGAATILAITGRQTLYRNLKENSSGGSRFRILATAGGLTTNYICFVAALQYLSPSTVLIVQQVAPFLVLAGGIVILRNPVTQRLLWGALLLVLGSVLFFNQRYVEIQWGSDFVIGVGIALVSATGWAAYFLFQKTLHGRLDSLSITFCCCAFGAIVLFPFSKTSVLWDLDGRLLTFLIASTFATAIGYTSVSVATRQITATAMGMALSLIPLVTVFNMILFANHIDGLEPENLNAVALLGAVFVVAGLMVGTTGGSKPVNEIDPLLAPDEV